MNTHPRFLLRIPQSTYDEMLAHALADLPNECCGLLAGKISEDGAVAEVTAHFPLRNKMRSPTEFVSDARDMFTAVKEMRKQAIDVLAVYHSHPSSPPIPSKRDLERSFGESVMNLIIGLGAGNAEVRGWWLMDAKFEAAGFEVVGDTPES